MSAIELTARSVEDAKKTAADKLGVDATRVTVKVLEETKGLFGKVNYRVLAEVIAEQEAAPAAAPAAKAEAKPKAGRGRTAKAEPAEV